MAVQDNEHKFNAISTEITQFQRLKHIRRSVKSTCKILCLNLFSEVKSTLSGKAFHTFNTRWLKNVALLLWLDDGLYSLYWWPRVLV